MNDLTLQGATQLMIGYGFTPEQLSELLTTDDAIVEQTLIARWQDGTVKDIDVQLIRPIQTTLTACDVLNDRFGHKSVLTAFYEQRDSLSGFTIADLIQKRLFDKLDERIEMIKNGIGVAGKAA